MKRIFILAALALLLLVAPVQAQSLLLLGSGGSGPVAAPFAGVLDEETTINHFWGVAAPGSAKTGNEAISICFVTGCSAANSCVNVKTISTGQLDTAVGTYCGNGTTGAVASVATACANATFGSTTNCASGKTARINSWCDQFAGSSSTCPAAITTASYAVSPDFILSGVNSLPTWGCVSSRSTAGTGTITTYSTGAISVGVSFERLRFSGFYNYFTDTDTAFAMGTNSTASGTAPQFQSSGAGGAGSILGTAADGTGTTDFSHLHRALLTIPSGGGTGDLYIDGAAPVTGSLSFTSDAGPTLDVCESNAGGYVDAFMTAMWMDPTTVSSAVGEAVTNQTTVPLP